MDARPENEISNWHLFFLRRSAVRVYLGHATIGAPLKEKWSYLLSKEIFEQTKNKSFAIRSRTSCIHWKLSAQRNIRVLVQEIVKRYKNTIVPHFHYIYGNYSILFSIKWIRIFSKLRINRYKYLDRYILSKYNKQDLWKDRRW